MSNTLNPDIPSLELTTALNDAAATMHAYGQRVLTPELLLLTFVRHDDLNASRILQHWESERANFLQVCPKEMLVHLPHPLSADAAAMPAE